jgi:hypothetical protein
MMIIKIESKVIKINVMYNMLYTFNITNIFVLY